MTAAAASSSLMMSSRLQQTLQAVAQSVQWTYSVFWQLCSQQWILVWGEGYYNGPIKTRKTVQPMEVSTEEASLQRSQQLRELYDSLAAGETNQPARRPCASLSPEDLTESEWFYLMCISFSFPRGVGLPGESYARRRHVWLTHANEVDTKVFSRAILAKSANIQTVLCIPLMDGVLELGTIEKVEEDIGLIQHIKSFFIDHHNLQAKSATSEQSTSNVVSSTNQILLQPQIIMQQKSNNDVHSSNHEDDENDDDDDDDDDNDVEDDDEDDDNIEGDEVIDHDGDGGEGYDDVEDSSESENKFKRFNNDTLRPCNVTGTDHEIISATEASELMQFVMSEDVRIGSADECSNNLESELQLLAVSHKSSDHHLLNNQRRDDTLQTWHFFQEDLYSGLQQSSGSQMEDLSPEDAHYFETVSSVLQHNLSVWANSSLLNQHMAQSQNSAFSKWDTVFIRKRVVLSQLETSSQWLLKKALLNFSGFHSSNYKCNKDDKYSSKEKDGDNVAGVKFRKGTTPQEELSVNHVLAERRRREKLNERFIILRSLVPFVTKMDKASILGDTIEYVKQLRRRIQDLEFKNKQLESHGKLTTSLELDQSKDEGLLRKSNSVPTNIVNQKVCISKGWNIPNKKVRVIEAELMDRPDGTLEASSINVQVSIKEDDAILELHCPHGDGLLLKIMQTLHGLQLEVTSIQSSSIDGLLDAKLRAKVRKVDGRRANIMEVKKAIYSIFPDQ